MCGIKSTVMTKLTFNMKFVQLFCPFGRYPYLILRYSWSIFYSVASIGTLTQTYFLLRGHRHPYPNLFFLKVWHLIAHAYCIKNSLRKFSKDTLIPLESSFKGVGIYFLYFYCFFLWIRKSLPYLHSFFSAGVQELHL